MSNTYKVYITSDDGEGYVQELHDWDEDNGPLVLRLKAFAKDAVITIEPITNTPQGKEQETV